MPRECLRSLAVLDCAHKGRASASKGCEIAIDALIRACRGRESAFRGHESVCRVMRGQVKAMRVLVEADSDNRSCESAWRVTNSAHRGYDCAFEVCENVYKNRLVL
jgi:hypothetical protein